MFCFRIQLFFDRVIGLGGLGHIAVKLATAIGAHVTVIALLESQRSDAIRLGAKAFILSNDRDKLKQADGSLNLIIDTVPVRHDVASMLQLLAFQGVFCMYICYLSFFFLNKVFHVGLVCPPNRLKLLH